METWVKLKGSKQQFHTSYKMVNISYQANGYVYIKGTSSIIRDLKIRHGFKDCSDPIVTAPQPKKEVKPSKSKKKGK